MARRRPAAQHAAMHTPTPPALQAWLQQNNPAAAYLRRTDADDDPRENADLDLLVFDQQAEELWVQRQALPGGATLDLLRLPATLLQDPVRLAAMGLVTHRLLSAEPVSDAHGSAAAVQAQVLAGWRAPAAVSARCAAFLDMGWLTVTEVGVTWDWPALARFWLHMAQAAAVATLADAAGLPCPNVYTRPLRWARQVAPDWVAAMVDTLGLEDTPPDAAAQALRHLHAAVSATCPEPAWPAAMRAATRLEYRYWLAPTELEERIAAASRMDAPAAVFYLRYAAYSLLRVAMLHQRALEGWPRHIPFIRPETEVRPDLERHHPALLPLAEALLGQPDQARLQHTLQTTQALQQHVLAVLQAQGLPVPDRRPWMPYRSQTAPPSTQGQTPTHPPRSLSS